MEKKLDEMNLREEILELKLRNALLWFALVNAFIMILTLIFRQETKMKTLKRIAIILAFILTTIAYLDYGDSPTVLGSFATLSFLIIFSYLVEKQQ